MNHNYTLARLYVTAVAANLVMLALIIRAYAEPFSLLMDPFSWLGKLETSSGFSNTGALILFTATLLFNSYIWSKTLSILFSYQIGRHPLVQILGRAVLAGFILMAFPCDQFGFIHDLGAGLVVGGLWACSTGLLYRVGEKIEPVKYFGLQLVLHISALFCGINFLIDSPLKGFSQKPLILAIIVEAGFCLKMLQQARTRRS